MLKKFQISKNNISQLILKVNLLISLAQMNLIKAHVIIMGKLATPILDANFVTQNHLTWSRELKEPQTRTDPKIFGYIKIRINFVLQEHRTKGKRKVVS